MNNHTDLLNYLATTFNLQSYLEIGVQNPVNNFDKIKCRKRVAVDPALNEEGYESSTYSGEETLFVRKKSDEYFKKTKMIFDLIFIDGLHHADQVKRDFENSLRCLNENGFIVIHDTLPEKEEYTHVPRDSKIWNGDVYKFACSLSSYAGIYFITADFDHGCTVVWKDDGKAKDNDVKKITTWKEFQENKTSLLHITPAPLVQLVFGLLRETIYSE